MRKNIIDMTGKQIWKLRILRLMDKKANKPARWECACECGTVFVTDGTSIRAGRTKSCGCLTRYKGGKRMRNGEYKTPTYRIWTGMLSRCNNKNDKKAHLYHNKGITVCERWHDFHNFLADMGERPAGMSIDRIDGSKGYSPDNCRWADAKTQGNNTNANVVLNHKNESLTVSQWAERVGIKQNTIIYRLRRGWSASDAITKPVESKFNTRYLQSNELLHK